MRPDEWAEVAEACDADARMAMVLGYSRLIWARFVAHQDLQTVLRCHMAASRPWDGVPRQILYDRMKTAVIGEDDQAREFKSTIREISALIRESLSSACKFRSFRQAISV